MKKLSFILLAVLVLTLIITQSFYYINKPNSTISKRSTLKFPPGVSMCGAALYSEKDSSINIPAMKGWGNYRWKVSTSSDSAQYYFNQGISFYYAFHSLEAIGSFAKATHIDPTFAMAWYGKALAMGPTINYDRGYSPPAGALEAALKSKLLSGNCSPLEKDLIAAIQYRYSTDTSISVTLLRERYATAMEKVYIKNKKSADAITLYADAVLLLHPWDMYEHDQKPKVWTPVISKLLEEAMRLSPKHPGANHYYIHTMEGSAHPEVALKSANLLDTLMPSVAHITHMPSHIYIRTGDYQRGIKVNDDAVAGYNNYIKKYSPVVNSIFLYEIHSLHLQNHSAQMAGNYRISVNSAIKVSDHTLQTGAPSLKNALGNYMQYVYSAPVLTYVRFGKWDEILRIEQTDNLLFADILLHFAKGVAYSRKQQFFLAKNELRSFRAKMNDRSLKEDAVTYSNAYSICKVAELILSGVISEDEGDFVAAVNAFELATVAEDRLIYSEPKAWPIPARQYLGRALNKSGKYNKAILVFNKDLRNNPNNGWSLTGLEFSYRMLGNADKLKQVAIDLKNSWKINDQKITSSVF